MNQQTRVAVIGNAGIDTNIYLAGPDIDWQHEANFTRNIDCIGQAGGYASRLYAGLGYETAFAGYLGDDYGGRWIHEDFAARGIDTRATFLDPAGTSRSVNIVYPDGRRKNFYDGKSHMTLSPDLDTCRAALSGCRLAHFNIPNWARYLLPLARREGAVIAVDLQDMIGLDDPYRRDFIAAADILFFSAANQEDIQALIEALFLANPGLGAVISGMGARGCALGTLGGVRFYPPVTMKRPVVDTNGAGDALAAGFLSSYILDGRPLEESIQRGQVLARYLCTLSAAENSFPTRANLDMLAAGSS